MNSHRIYKKSLIEGREDYCNCDTCKNNFVKVFLAQDIKKDRENLRKSIKESLADVEEALEDYAESKGWEKHFILGKKTAYLNILSEIDELFGVEEEKP